MHHVTLKNLQQLILDYVAVMSVVRVLKHLVGLIEDDDQMAHLILIHTIEQVSNLCIALPASASQRSGIVYHYVRIQFCKLSEYLSLATACRSCEENILSPTIYMIPEKHGSCLLRFLLTIYSAVKIFIYLRRRAQYSFCISASFIRLCLCFGWIISVYLLGSSISGSSCISIRRFCITRDMIFT